jgi:hypothetical protein
MGRLTPDEYYERMKYHGYDAANASEMALASRADLGLAEIIAIGRRDGRTDAEILELLEFRGASVRDKEAMLRLSQFYPGPQDLISWMAKEVFEPDSVQRYGLADEFDRLDLGLFRGAGVSPEQARNFWIAHWEHASWNDVKEMMWRGLITEKDAWEWFRLVEIPPFWRQKLIDISYSPYTRVDARRMHKMGVLSEPELLQAYKDIGYNEERAQRLVEWTIKYNQNEDPNPDRDLTRAQLEKGFELGILTQPQFEGALSAMGYDEDEVPFIVALNEERVRMTYAGDWLGVIKTQVVSGLMTLAQADAKLSAMGFSSTAVEHYHNLFLTWSEVPSKIPSKSDVKEMLRAGSIDAPTAFDYLRQLGYLDKDITRYLETWAGGPERYAVWIRAMMAAWGEFEAEQRLGSVPMPA